MCNFWRSNMRKLVICILAVCGAAGTVRADGLSQSFTVTQNLNNTDWISQLAIPQFNVDGAVLDSAVLTYGGTVVYNDTITNSGVSDGKANLSNSAVLDFGYNSDADGGTVAAGSELISSALNFNNTQVLPVPASSTVTTGPTSVDVGPGTYNVVDLSPLTGGGYYMLDVAATGLGSIFSNIFTFSSSVSTSASAYVTVTYNYHLADAQPSVSVPWGPPAAQLLLAGGLLALARCLRFK